MQVNQQATPAGKALFQALEVHEHLLVSSLIALKAPKVQRAWALDGAWCLC